MRGDNVSDKTTGLIHHPYVPPAGFVAPQPGVFKASTVIFPNVAALRSREWKDKTGYTYGLHGTPTSYVLEERLCTLEGGSQRPRPSRQSLMAYCVSACAHSSVVTVSSRMATPVP